MFHYTNSDGHKAISSQPVWLFKAAKPPGDHPKGAYFTTLSPGEPNLAKRLFIRGGADKVVFAFCFSDGEDLKPLPGGRREFIFYSESDYSVEGERQRYHGRTAAVPETLKMIGGTDIVIPTFGGTAALDACIRMVTRYWLEARFENAVTGEKYPSYGEIPIGNVQELLIYPNAEAEAQWDAGALDAAANSQIYLILSEKSVTVVVDDPTTVEVRALVESLRVSLRMDIMNIQADVKSFAEAV